MPQIYATESADTLKTKNGLGEVFNSIDETIGSLSMKTAGTQVSVTNEIAPADGNQNNDETLIPPRTLEIISDSIQGRSFDWMRKRSVVLN